MLNITSHSFPWFKSTCAQSPAKNLDGLDVSVVYKLCRAILLLIATVTRQVNNSSAVETGSNPDIMGTLSHLNDSLL